MSATFEVVLDTHAPVLSVSPGQWDAVTHTLTIPCSTDEPATFVASYAPFNSEISYPLWRVGETLTATLPDGIDGGNGHAYVTVMDDVLNSSSYVLTLGREPAFVPTVRTWTADLSGPYGRPAPPLRLTAVTPPPPIAVPGGRGRVPRRR